jgi:glycosyltransferase involved in cell wall biosynthesis
MRLLIITQKVDIQDSILGFFHGWIIEFAKHCESIVVICLEKGVSELPAHVRLHSLGKEDHVSRWTYIMLLYSYAWSLRKDYDAVFVHMNQEYVLLAGLLWKLLGKPIYLWRNHARGTILTRCAVALSTQVFCTSPQSFTARFSKTSIMPVGVDTELFSPDSSVARKRNSVVCLGRISPVKKIEDIIEGVKMLAQTGIQAYTTIVGNPTPDARGYYDRLKSMVRDAGLAGNVVLEPAVAHAQVPAYYRANEIYVNATPEGSADKTIFEAMACGSLVVVRNGGMVGDVVEGGYVFTDAASLAEVLQRVMSMDDERKRIAGAYVRNYVMTKHSLTVLVSRLIATIEIGVSARR